MRPAGESPVRVSAGALGNAAKKFNQIDSYVFSRLRGLMIKRYRRNLRAGQTSTWTRGWFEAHGLYRLRGTIRYQGYAP